MEVAAVDYIDKSVAELWTVEKLIDEIPLVHLSNNRKEYGDLIPPSLDSPVRNMQWDYLFFHDVSVFSPAANDFRKSERDSKGSGRRPQYCPYIKGTKRYREYWIEQRKRCLEGYEPIVNGRPCGVRISGEYYFYLNFFRIEQAGIDPNTGEETRVEDFPLFCSMDYYYFKELEARENPGRFGLPSSYKKHLIIAKARRKGFSYKNAAGALWKFCFFALAKIAIISERGEKAVETFQKASFGHDFLTEYTEFGGPLLHRSVDAKTGKAYMQSGVKDKHKGINKGRLSVIYTVSLHHADDKASGAGCVRVIFEEAGMIRNIKKAWRFTEPTLRSGKIIVGIAVVFGTGGDMDGATKGFADMFNNPEAYGFAAFDNIYEKNQAKTKCGLFIADMWFRQGAQFVHPKTGEVYEALDENGNARFWVAELDLNKERETAKKGEREDYNVAITQWAKTPSEAFMTVEGNYFPVPELQEHLTYLRTSKQDKLLATKGTLVETTEGVVFKPDVLNELEILDRYPLPSNYRNREGCVVQYERPIRIGNSVPEGAYLISMDPIGIDDDGGESLIAIYCFKTKKYASEIGHDEIVMSYVGRAKYDPIDHANYILLKMSKYYNAKVTHENDRGGKLTRDFFVKHGEFSRLLKPPVNVVESALEGPSRTNLRKSGHSFGNKALKELGKLTTKKWLLEKRKVDDEGNEIMNLHMIPDPALIEELISYNDEKNCDRVMALMGFCIQQKEVFNEYVRKENATLDEVREFFNPHLKAIREKQKRHGQSQNGPHVPRTTSSFFGKK